MADPTPNVRDALKDSGAVLLRASDVGRGISLAEWRNCDTHARYDRPAHHTLSLYLHGGEGVVREEGHISGGGPDKLCVLPAGHESRWRIAGPLRMFHLYIAPETLAYQAAARFGIDLGQTTLMDLTFADDPSAAMIVRGGVLPLDWSEGADTIALSSACQVLIHRMLRHRGPAGTAPVKGGLAPSARRRVVEHIDAHLASGLTLEALADAAGLSTFHFAKMFRADFGMPPHRYVTECRVRQAKRLLAEGRESLADVATRCGYSSQSHFSRAFKQIAGVTPAAWRLAAGGFRPHSAGRRNAR